MSLRRLRCAVALLLATLLAAGPAGAEGYDETREPPPSVYEKLVDAVVVRWPDGTTTRREEIAANQQIVVEQP